MLYHSYTLLQVDKPQVTLLLLLITRGLWQAKELSKLVTVPKRMLPWRMMLFKQVLLWASEKGRGATATASPGIATQAPPG